MAISSERLQELLEIYNALKARIILVDEKYSLDFVEPKLDMPDSLNLTKLTYTPKSEDELRDIAEQKAVPALFAKQAAIDQAYNTKDKNLYIKIDKLKLTKDKKLAALQEALDESLADIHNRLVNNGLIFSTISTKYEGQARQDYNNKSAQLNQDTEQEIALIKKEQDELEKIYIERCLNVREELALRIEQNYQKLLEEEEKLQRSIEKYNTGLDEKEQKYQASRARAYENARRAAYARAYNNSKLYMEMGEVGYRRMIEKEKYAVSQDAFFPLRRDEANAILAMDSFLVAHLGTYYSAFEAWVNTTLLP